VLTQNSKISARQAFIIFMVSILSAAIRLFPTSCAEIGEQAAWLAPIFGALPLLLLCLILSALFKKQSVAGFFDAIKLSLGKIGGGIMVSFYLFWVMIVYFIYIRYFAERLLSTIFPDTDIQFFIYSMMILVFIGARGKLETFARFSEVAFFLFTVVLIAFFILLIPTVKAENLLPITHYNLLPAAKAAYPILGIWGYLTLIYFLGDSVADKGNIMRIGKKGVVFLAFMTTLILVFVIGSVGYTVARRMPVPFFSATKLITIMEGLDRLEPVLLSVWIILDFIIITLFAKLVMRIAKNLFAVSEEKYLASPVVLLGAVGSQLLASSRFELETFSSKLGILINIITCFVFPAVVLAVGKLRKKI